MDQFTVLAQDELSRLGAAFGGSSMVDTLLSAQSACAPEPEATAFDEEAEIAVALRVPTACDGLARGDATVGVSLMEGDNDPSITTKNATILHTMDSMRRAREGRVRIKHNKRDPESTMWLEGVTTRAHLQAILKREMGKVAQDNLQPQYLRNRRSYLTQYADFMRECFGS